MNNTALSALGTVVIGTALMVLTFPTAPIASLLSLVWAYTAWHTVSDHMSVSRVWTTVSFSLASLVAGIVALLQTAHALTA